MRSSSGTRRSIAFLFAVLVLAFAARPALAQSWGSSGFTLSVLPANCLLIYPWEAAVNASGQIGTTCQNTAGGLQTTLLTASGETFLGLAAPTSTIGIGINDAGEVAGYQAYTNPSGGLDVRATLYDGSNVQDIGTFPGGGPSYAYGVNNAGQAIGMAGTATGSYDGFFWNGTSMVDMGTLGGNGARPFALNQSGQVVGFSYTGAGLIHAFLYSGGSMNDLGVLQGPGGLSEGLGINDLGQATGVSSNNSGYYHAFLYDTGVMQDLGTLGASYLNSEGFGISDSGQVVGYSWAGADTVATLWDSGHAYALGNVVGGGWTFTSASIAPSGAILAQGELDGVSHDVLLTPNAATVTPEPAVVWLLATGLLALGLFARRRVLA